MKKILSFFLLLSAAFAVPISSFAQQYDDPKYLKGAVTEENGIVVFRQTFTCEGRSKAQIYNALEEYTKALTKSEKALMQCRLTQMTPDEGIVAASIEETLTFKSTNWILDTARFFYQIVFTTQDNGFEAMMRRIHYIYEPMEVPGLETGMKAEDWINDANALSKSGKLTKVGGKKFRLRTIDRKDEIFRKAYEAVMK